MLIWWDSASIAFPTRCRCHHHQRSSIVHGIRPRDSDERVAMMSRLLPKAPSPTILSALRVALRLSIRDRRARYLKLMISYRLLLESIISRSFARFKYVLPLALPIRAETVLSPRFQSLPLLAAAPERKLEMHCRRLEPRFK